MSGRPSKDGVTQAVMLINKLEDACVQINRLEASILTQSNELTVLRSTAQQAEKELNELMKSMDVASPGNWGHENRRNWFLVELIKQVKEINNALQRSPQDRLSPHLRPTSN